METVSLDLRHESDAGLLLLIGAAGTSLQERALANEALRQLHARYYGPLVSILRQYAENEGTVVIDPEEFALATFKKAFKSAHRFCDMSDGDPVKAKAQVKAWLTKIARNLALDELDRISRQKRRLPLEILDETHDVTEPPPDCGDAEPTNPRALAELRAILDTLKPEEREILKAYAAHGIPTENGRELPKDVRDALEDSTGYERCTIRQKWRRLSQRLKTALEPYLDTKQNISLLCLTTLPSPP